MEPRRPTAPPVPPTSALGSLPPLDRTARPRRIGVAVFSLVVLGLLIPFVALALAVFTGPLFGSVTPVAADQQARLGWFVAGAVCGALAFAGAVVALIIGWGIANRVIAGFAIVVGLVVAVGMGGLSVLTARSIPDQSPPAASEPTCGPESHPALYGGDSLWNPCPEDIAAAQQFADSVLPALPTVGVTVDSVESVATDPDLLGGLSAETYVGSRVGPGGSVSVAWVAAPVTCAIITWDGAAYATQVTGALIEGGCLYDGR